MFENAQWIHYVVSKPENPPEKYEPSAYMAKTFFLFEKPEKAILNICGYGEAAYFLNGNEIPDSFRPTWPTTPSKTVIYNVYDLTDQLKEGKNRLGMILSRHRCYMKAANAMLLRDKTPQAIFQLDLRYANGKSEQIVSNLSVRACLSPIIFTENLCGEIYDARREIPNWCHPEFDDSEWKNVLPAEAPGGIYREAVGDPIRKWEENKGVEIASGLFDFGKETAGHVRIKITGKAGSRVKLDYSERLLPDRTWVDMSAYKKETQPHPDMYNSDEYILDGTPEKEMEPRFSIHGFRYVGVKGEYDHIELTQITAHTDLRTVSYFECDNEILNGIHRAAVTSMLTCCQDFFVDNPKRDAPWVGDQMLSAESIAMQFDSFAISYENMMMCRDAQNSQGVIPAVVPAFNGNWSFQKFIGPDWSGGVVFHVPYFTYLYTGNRKIIDELWETMERTLDSFSDLGEGFLLNRLGTGDWSAVKGGCSLEVCMTAYYRVSALMMAAMADATGRNSQKYRLLAENIRKAYREKYISHQTLLASHITEYILPAAVGFLTPEEERKAVEQIVRMIRSDSTAFTFGTHGNRMIFDLLSRHGYGQLIYEVLCNETVLGYAKQIRDGLNTLPETFTYQSSPIMSCNHHFFSPVNAWFYRWVAGIQVEKAGFRQITIRPLDLPGIRRFRASLHGICVESDGRRFRVHSPVPFTFLTSRQKISCQAGDFTFPKE